MISGAERFKEYDPKGVGSRMKRRVERKLGTAYARRRYRLLRGECQATKGKLRGGRHGGKWDICVTSGGYVSGAALFGAKQM